MRQTAIKIALFLFIGAIINLAVAWTIAWRSGTWYHAVHDDQWGRITKFYPAEIPVVRRVGHFRGRTWVIETSWHVPNSFTQRISDDVFMARLPRWSALHATSPAHAAFVEDGTASMYSEYAAGWPFRVVRGSEHWRDVLTTTGQQPTATKSSMIMVRSQAVGWRLLPYHPVALGVVVNTVLYALLLWMIVRLALVPRAIIRQRRADRGVCRKCAFDLRGANHERCPECGYPTYHVCRDG